VLIPGVQQMVRIDLRTVVLDVPARTSSSHDNVSVKVNRVYFRVVDPQRAVIQVEKFLEATSQLAQRRCARCSESTAWMKCWPERDKLNTDIQRVLDSQTTPGA